MTAAWAVVILVGTATVTIKAMGPVLLGARGLPPRVLAVVRLLAPALLGALVVTQALSGPDGVAVDERLLGLGAAVGGLLLRLPVLAVVVAAAAVTAVARLVL